MSIRGLEQRLGQAGYLVVWLFVAVLLWRQKKRARDPRALNIYHTDLTGNVRANRAQIERGKG